MGVAYRRKTSGLSLSFFMREAWPITVKPSPTWCGGRGLSPSYRPDTPFGSVINTSSGAERGLSPLNVVDYRRITAPPLSRLVDYHLNRRGLSPSFSRTNNAHSMDYPR